MLFYGIRRESKEKQQTYNLNYDTVSVRYIVDIETCQDTIEGAKYVLLQKGSNPNGVALISAY